METRKRIASTSSPLHDGVKLATMGTVGLGVTSEATAASVRLKVREACRGRRDPFVYIPTYRHARDYLPLKMDGNTMD